MRKVDSCECKTVHTSQRKALFSQTNKLYNIEYAIFKSTT